MNKSLAIGAVSLLALVAAACGSDNKSTSTTSAAAGGGTSAPAGKAYKLAFVQGVAGDNFYISMQCGIEAAAKAAGASVTTQGPDKFDATLQTPIVDAVVASKPDALLIAPTDVKAMERPIKAAADAGIKVVLVDTTLDDPSSAVSQIASDNLAGGKAAADAIVQLVPDGGKVLVINVKPGISTTDARQKGFEDAIKANSKFQYLGNQYSNNDPAKAAAIVTASLQKDPDIKGIFATNLFSAEGAATGLRQAGKLDQVKIVGFDAGPAQVKDLQDGTVQALIAQKPAEIGLDGVTQALNALTGKPVEAKISTGFEIVTKANLDTPAIKDVLYKASC